MDTDVAAAARPVAPSTVGAAEAKVIPVPTAMAAAAVVVSAQNLFRPILTASRPLSDLTG
jgi:ABC-type phosphate transport system substrate-binding protein